MKNRIAVCLFLLVFTFSAGATPAAERTFTDDQGRQVQAELVGLRDDHVVLKRNGRMAQWPTGKLSKQDQAFVAAWKKTSRSTPPRIQVKIWERDGIGENGVLNDGKLEFTLLKNIPGLKQTEEKGDYKHYDIDLHNNSPVDANNVILSYVLYVITPQRKVVGENGSETVSSIKAGTRETVTSKGITYVRSKTTSTTFSTNILGNLQPGSQTNRSKETFGGAWVRVFSPDGKMVGEAKSLSSQLEKLDPQWTGHTAQTALPVPRSFSQLEELLAPLKEMIKNLPEPPVKPGGKGPPGLPPFPK